MAIAYVAHIEARIKNARMKNARMKNAQNLRESFSIEARFLTPEGGSSVADVATEEVAINVPCVGYRVSYRYPLL